MTDRIALLEQANYAANAIISQQADEMAGLQRRLDHRNQALRIMRTSPSIAGCMSGVSLKAIMPFIDAALSDEPLKPHLTCAADGETNPIERLSELVANLAAALGGLRDRYVPNDETRPEVAAADDALSQYRRFVEPRL